MVSASQLCVDFIVGNDFGPSMWILFLIWIIEGSLLVWVLVRIKDGPVGGMADEIRQQPFSTFKISFQL